MWARVIYIRNLSIHCKAQGHEFLCIFTTLRFVDVLPASEIHCKALASAPKSLWLRLNGVQGRGIMDQHALHRVRARCVAGW